MPRRVVITGIGIIAPTGSTTEEFWKNSLDGVAAAAPIPAAWTGYCTYSSPIWAPLPYIDFSAHGISRIEQMQIDKTGMLAIAAASQALRQAGLGVVVVDEKKARHTIPGIDSSRAGVVVGTGAGGITSLVAAEANHVLSPLMDRIKQLRTDGNACVVEDLQRLMIMPPRYNPFVVSMLMPNSCANLIGIRYALSGANETCCCACASGTVAVGRAFERIAAGTLDIALAGGVEYLGDDFGGIFRGFDAAKTLVRAGPDALRANRPFDRDRSGFLFAEGGGCILVLEEAGHARARGAQPIAGIASFAESFDAHNIMMIDPAATAIIRMINTALDRAGIQAKDIDYVNTHGTGTESNDEVESRVIDEIFGRRPLVNATKSLIGHTIGAAGAIEAGVTALSIQCKTTHGCANLQRPVRDLNFVTTTRHAPIRTALTQSFAFGGHNAALVIQEYS